ncbi:olfactory receptor 7A10-like [Dasypus novemcinctus]|uniref:olfactory receptor 7A10-like n=1 Tax=Dasypus novemcinctus TaxID=9361 RepID=UPI0039C96CDE
METENQTCVLEFVLLGLSEDTGVQPLLFGLFLLMYLVTFTGNLLIILAIISDSHLHTPMYFFLSNLSFTDICFTSTTVPKMLLNIQTERKIITFENCLSQIFLYIIFGQLDNTLLTIMAYDRFVAICHPLHYMVIMSPRFCGTLLLASWLLSALYSLLQCLMVLRLSFCTKLEIPHFFCELNQVIRLACSDTFLNDLVIYFASGLLGVIPLTGILFSYSKIISSILRISTAEGKYKAFSTCGSHLSVVTLFYGTGLGVYLSSTAYQNSRTNAIASVMYVVIIPMLNPFIYSLRNKDMKQAMGNILSAKQAPQVRALAGLLDNHWYFGLPVVLAYVSTTPDAAATTAASVLTRLVLTTVILQTITQSASATLRRQEEINYLNILENCPPNASLKLLPWWLFDKDMNEGSYVYNTVYAVAQRLHEMFLQRVEMQSMGNGDGLIVESWQSPHSVCNEKFIPGFRKSSQEGKRACCFLCTACPENEVSNETEKDDAVKQGKMLPGDRSIMIKC